MIEQIDIGGPAMIRAAAKNLPSPPWSCGPRATTRCSTSCAHRATRLSLPTREALAGRGVRLHRPLRHGDRALVRREREEFPALHVRAFEKVLDLPYGENPHQRAAYYSQVGARTHVLSMVRQLGRQASCRSTTCSTSTPPASWWTSSRCRPARSSSTTTRAAPRSGERGRRPTGAPSPAIPRAPSAASSCLNRAVDLRVRARRWSRSSPSWCSRPPTARTPWSCC